jgi:hypothetical protein
MNLTVLHELVQALFPDIPPNIDDHAVEQKYFFRNAFTGSVAICEFRKNEVSYILSNYLRGNEVFVW